jgi:hypothetical protein
MFGRHPNHGASGAAGHREGAAQRGGQPVCGLLQPFLDPLRLDHPFLVEQPPAKPAECGNRHQGDEGQNEEQRSGRFQPTLPTPSIISRLYTGRFPVLSGDCHV